MRKHKKNILFALVKLYESLYTANKSLVTGLKARCKGILLQVRDTTLLFSFIEARTKKLCLNSKKSTFSGLVKMY